MPASLKERIDLTRQRIAAAADLAGRDAASVRLIAVSKSHPGWMVRAARDLGLRVFGENRVQEGQEKAAALTGLDIEWHLVGRLQKNKVRQALGVFGTIHSVDSLPLLERMDRIAAELAILPRALVQVDLAGEKTKTGVPPVVLPELLRRAADMRHVEIVGLMVLPPYFEQAERARPYFRKVADLRAELDGKGCYRSPLGELSMGMSHDFDIAISEGATMVRVGTAIFGERPKPGQPDLN